MKNWKNCTWGDIVTLEYGKGLQGYQSQTSGYRVFGTNGPIGWHSEYLCETEGVIVGRKVQKLVNYAISMVRDTVKTETSKD